MTTTTCDLCQQPITRSLALPIDHTDEQVSFTLWIHPGKKLHHVKGAVCLECGWMAVKSHVETLLKPVDLICPNEVEDVA